MIMLRTTLFSTIALGALLLTAAAPGVRAATTAPPSSTSITVSATGTVQVPPDQATVSAGVVKTALDAATAQAEANVVATQVIAAVRALGIPARDLQTAGISLNPQYDDNGVLTGFQATDTLVVTVTHLKQAGAVIDAAVHAGANQGISLSFGLQDPSAAQTAALQAAVRIAQAKAAAVARELGVSLTGAHVQLVENLAQPVQPVYAQTLAAPAPSRAPSTPVESGTLTVQDNVTLTYIL
jgi:uncharacterized protein YggE